jgi:Mrp family chromosome partitioning ATPase
VSTSIGRDGLLDVIPSGRWAGDEPEPAVAEDARHALTRLAGRYDMAVLVAPATHAERAARSLLPSPDVVVCARVGHTPLVRLVQTVDQLRSAGERVLGLVLWEDDPPSLASTEELAPRRRWTPRSRMAVEESAVS